MINPRYGKILLLLTISFFLACKTITPTAAPMTSLAADTSMLFDIKRPLDLKHLTTELPDGDAAKAFSASLEKRTIQEAYLVQVNPDLIKTDMTSLTVPFPDGRVVRFQQ